MTRAMLSVLLTGSALVASSDAAMAGDFHRCHYKGHDGRWSTAEVQQTIRCAVAHFPTSLSTAMYVANRESNFTATARNPYSGTSGIYQHMMRYWAGRVATFRHRHPYWHIFGNVFNARSNVLVTIDMASRTGWGPWGG